VPSEKNDAIQNAKFVNFFLKKLKKTKIYKYHTLTTKKRRMIMSLLQKINEELIDDSPFFPNWESFT